MRILDDVLSEGGFQDIPDGSRAGAYADVILPSANDRRSLPDQAADFAQSTVWRNVEVARSR